MAKINPFRGTRFNKKKVGNISKVVCLPYDVINDKQRRDYIKKSKYNVVNLILPKGNTETSKQQNSKKLLNKWIKSGVLTADKEPCIYVCTQEYIVDGVTKTRMGFTSLLELEGKKKILPHEKIFDKFKFERSGLMRVTQAHLSPIFTLFNDNGKRVEKLLLQAMKGKRPSFNINANGIKEKLWVVSDPKIISPLRKAMSSKKVFIADGHHRTEASRFLRDYMRSKNGSKSGKMPYDYTMSFFLSMQDKGMSILPTHRAVKQLPKGFSMDFLLKKLGLYFSTQIVKNNTQLLKKLNTADAKKQKAFGFFYDNTYIFAELRDKSIIKNIGPAKNCKSWKQLDVSILHYLIFPELLNIEEKIKDKPNIYYYRGKSEAVNMVKSGKLKLAVILNTTKIEEVQDVAEASNKMPHKSTFFYPKLLTGLIIHKFNPA